MHLNIIANNLVFLIDFLQFFLQLAALLGFYLKLCLSIFLNAGFYPILMLLLLLYRGSGLRPYITTLKSSLVLILLFLKLRIPSRRRSRRRRYCEWSSLLFNIFTLILKFFIFLFLKILLLLILLFDFLIVFILNIANYLLFHLDSLFCIEQIILIFFFPFAINYFLFIVICWHFSGLLFFLITILLELQLHSFA